MDSSTSKADTQAGQKSKYTLLDGADFDETVPLGSGTLEPVSSQVMPSQPPGLRYRNFIALAAYQISMRVGWIFKTESVIMPAIMDLLCGPGTALASWMRSWLPQLNRLGQSIPQLLFADRVRNTGRKKYVVAICSGSMGLVFLGLAMIWVIKDSLPGYWMQVGFLLLYALFFICVGVNNLGFNTLQGKLIPYNLRGRLFLFANGIGGVAAICAAWFLLRGWFSTEGGYLVYVFGFAGICFLVGAALSLLCSEKKGEHGPVSQKRVNFLCLPFALFQANRQFRLLAVIAACFGMSMVLFPHYQALYRESVANSTTTFSFQDLVVWVILQNAGTVIFSLLAGPAADRFGNRFVLQLVLLLLSIAPAIAVYFSWDVNFAKRYYFLVFLILGVTPVTIRVLNNFALELAPSESHPHFLSALSLCMAFPVILFSQIAGWLIPILGFDVVFMAIFGIILVGWFFSFFVGEPRNQLTTDGFANDNS